MTVRKKPKSEEEFIQQASTVVEQKSSAPEPEKAKVRKTELRVPENIYLALENHLQPLDIKPSRNQWILMAIKEKIARDSKAQESS